MKEDGGEGEKGFVEKGGVKKFGIMFSPAERLFNPFFWFSFYFFYPHREPSVCASLLVPPMCGEVVCTFNFSFPLQKR